MSIYEELGVRTIINAKGPSTRLSGGFLDDEVARAMVEASRHCVDIAELQAAASRSGPDSCRRLERPFLGDDR